VQRGYAERVLRTFGMWDCSVCILSAEQVRTISRSSILVCKLPSGYCNMCVVLMIRYLPGQILTYFDQNRCKSLVSAETKNKLIGWVDSDFASDPDTRKSMTGYLVSLNGGAISWRSSRQGGVTLSSSEAEFVAASWTEVAYLCVLLRGFGYTQKKPREIWEDNASYVMMSKNPTNRDRSRRVDVKVHYLRDLVRDGHVKLVKCAGTQNVSDALTKSLARPNTKVAPVMAYCIKFQSSFLRLRFLDRRDL
jgi:hypothetical protein